MNQANLYSEAVLEHLPLTSDFVALSTFGVASVDGVETAIRVDATGALVIKHGEDERTITTQADAVALSESYELALMSENRFVMPVAGQTHLWISDVNGAEVQVNSDGLGKGVLLERETPHDSWRLNALAPTVYYRGRRLNRGETAELMNGESLAFGGVKIRVYADELHFFGERDWFKTALPVGKKSHHDKPAGYPEYRRSPRLILRAPDGEVTLPSAPAPKDRDNDGLVALILPPLATMGVTVGMGLTMGRGLMVLAMAGTTVITTVFSVQKYFKDKKKRKQEVALETAGFEETLNDKLIEIVALNDEQRRNALYHYPNFEELFDMVVDVSPRLYEKTPQHFDFLTYRLGLGTVPTSATFKYEAKAEQRKSELGKRAQRYYDDNRELDNMPIIGSLNQGVVGYVGQRQLVIEQLQLMILQLATFQSYHDLEFVTIFPEEEREQWDWMRWLPHAKLSEVATRGFVYNQRTRDQVLGSVNAILKERKNALSEAKRSETPIFLPHLVILVTDEKLVMDHTIMEFLQEDPSELGVSLVFTADVQSSLRENVKTVIDIRDSKTGNLVMSEGMVMDQTFALDHFPVGFNKEHFTRPLAAIDHQLNLKSSIPETLDFLQMYGVKTVDELNILQRWEAGQPRKTLAVPIGWRAESDVVELNLHEKADGPHGLLAGTTGSGKTEVVKDLITSLAVNFKPTDVAFLPIDFKGGALANDLEPLPHTVGAITNLDAASAMRALASINAEMKRRQAMFGDAGVSNINDYHKLIESGEVTVPMPHLVMISDEFAELKNQMPEFLDELVSIARVGRSLGVHLILATQKPAGVVNDQIWANSKFKIALKVADAQDSKEILKTPDAAEITQTGRGYLQVGNGERYEVFQTAYSGAAYKPEADENKEQELVMYRINDLGQYELLTQTDNAEVEALGLAESQMEAIVKKINEIFDANEMVRPEKVWLPPLADVIYAEDVEAVDFKDVWQETDKNLDSVATIGMMDLPAKQDQQPLQIDFNSDGHLAIFSSPTYGKTTVLQTMLMSLMRKNRPDEARLEILDFGLSGLIAFKDAPHTNDYLTLDDEEEIKSWLTKTRDEITQRKQLLSDNKVATVNDYRASTGQGISELYVFVDAYENSSQEKWRTELEDVLVLIARQGTALGMHLIITAGKSSFIRANILANIRRRIMFTINEQGEASTILGRTRLEPLDRPGAGLVKDGDDIVQFQALYPVKTDEDAQLNMLLMDEVEDMDSLWQQIKPSDWQAQPEPEPELDTTMSTLVSEYEDDLEPGEMIVGRSVEFADEMVVHNFREAHGTIIVVKNARDIPNWIAAIKQYVGISKGFTLEKTTAGQAFRTTVLPDLLEDDNWDGPVLVASPESWLTLYDDNSTTREAFGIEKPDRDELVQFFEQVPFILIGTQTDLELERDFMTRSTYTNAATAIVFAGTDIKASSLVDQDVLEGTGAFIEDGFLADINVVDMTKGED